MSREILKKTLLDLKKQMRGKRAESYMRDDDDEPVKKTPKLQPKESGDHADRKLEDSKKPASDSKGSMEGAPDFAAEMKKFMSKQNKGKPRVTKVMSGSSFEDMAKKPEIIVKKGK